MIVDTSKNPDKMSESELRAEVKYSRQKIDKLESALREIRDVARCSEGVEFYEMLASRALRGEG